MTNFSEMLSKAKEMQEKMKQVQDNLKKIEVEGVSGGNLVKVVLTGDYEIKSIEISEEAKKEKHEIDNFRRKSIYGIIKKYNWNFITSQYLEVFNSLVKQRN